MLRGLYTAGTAMIAQNRRMDVITNNMVNVETVGYKQDVMVTQSFRDMLISRINDPSVYQYSMVGPHNTGIHVDTIYSVFQQGSLTASSNPTDIALATEGCYFVVEYTSRTLIPPTAEERADPDYEPEYEYGETEERYTRAGNFNVDAEGYLVTPMGYYVQGQGGNIMVGTSDFVVDAGGGITVDGEYIDTLRIVAFEDQNVLRKAGSNLFTAIGAVDEDGDEIPAEPIDVTAEVRQFFLEESNVDVASETVRMMEAYRAFEINQRVVRMYDESLGRTVNDIARV